jgi:hypothetical protein
MIGAQNLKAAQWMKGVMPKSGPWSNKGTSVPRDQIADCVESDAPQSE